MSKLFLDTLQGNLPPVFGFSMQRSEGAKAVAGRDFQRGVLADILTAQAQAFGSDLTSSESINRLRDPRSVVVIAGQQAGWFGGPLLSLTKALAVAKAAKLWSESLGIPVVPVFWIASDDHDLDEIRGATLLNRSGQLTTISYPNDGLHRSAGESTLNDSDALSSVRSTFQQSIGSGEYADRVCCMVSDCCNTGDTYATSFAKLFAQLTSGTGLILFSPSDPAVKRLAIPWFEQLITCQSEMNDRFQKRSAMLAASGYHAQVEKRSDAAFLFHHAPAREPVNRSGESWSTASQSWSTSDLLALLKSQPERFSPDVISRPLLQSWLFPVLAQIGGPSEIAYLHQVAPLFELFSLARPMHLARPGVTCIDRRSAELMDHAKVTFERLLAVEPDSLMSSVLSDSFPKEIQQQLENIRSDIRNHANRLSSVGLSIDQQTSDFASQTAGKIDYLIGQFEEKLSQAHRRKEKETRERWQRAINLVAPNHGLQERAINTLALLAKFGPKLPDIIAEAIDPDSPDHRILII